MTQAEIGARLQRLKFVGGWSKNALVKECGLSRSTVLKAMDGIMSRHTQVRLTMVLKVIKPFAPVSQRVLKNKPGHKKRYLIRYYNLVSWLRILQNENVTKKYAIKRQTDMSKEEAAFICTKYDYIAKRYLLDILGSELQRKKITLADCYSFEQWVKRVSFLLPDTRKELLCSLQIRTNKRK